MQNHWQAHAPPPFAHSPPGSVISDESQPHLSKYITAYSNTPACLKSYRKRGAGAVILMEDPACVMRFRLHGGGRRAGFYS